MKQRTIPVRMRFCGNASDSDLAPLLDALQSTLANVAAAIGPPRPEHPGGTGLFPFTLELAFDIDIEEPGTLAEASRLAREWFLRHLGSRLPDGVTRANVESAS